MKTFLPLLCALLAASLHAADATPLKAVPGATFNIEPHFIGFNQPFAGQTDPWSRGTLLRQVQIVEGANFRYPAGTLGSYWNWKTGRLDESLDKAKVMDWVRPMMNGRGDYKPAHLATPARRAGVAPVWMLGMAVHTVKEYIAELKRAEALGIPVRYLELGNEIIFNKAEPLLEEKFPTAERYGEVATEWIAALKRAFPHAKIAACGSFVASDSQSERRRTWNGRLMKTLRGADAITFHLYVRDVLRDEQERAGLTEVASQNRATRGEQAAARAPLTPERVAATLGIVDSFLGKSFEKTGMPPGMDVWVTEWNAGGAGGSGQNWLGGLVAAALLDACLKRDVTLTCHHTMGGVFSGGGGRGGAQSTGTEPNAFGIALRAFARATTGATSATRLEFPGGPQVKLTSGGAYAGLLGWRFTGSADGTRVLLANLSSAEVLLAADGLAKPGGNGVRLHGQPGDAPAQVREDAVTVESGLTLPPFSITVLNPHRRE